MFTKKRIIWLVIIISLILLIIPGIIDYFEYRSVVKAVSSMPWQDGGEITMVREPCILDTPAIDTVGQLGTTFMAAPIGFVYRGGGTHPTAGMQFLAGGSTNAQPWVIGIPGKSAIRIQKVADWFNYMIAGFKGD
jgi:hypothetical protein